MFYIFLTIHIHTHCIGNISDKHFGDIKVKKNIKKNNFCNIKLWEYKCVSYYVMKEIKSELLFNEWKLKNEDIVCNENSENKQKHKSSL